MPHNPNSDISEEMIAALTQDRSDFIKYRELGLKT